MDNNHSKDHNSIMNLLALYAEKVDRGDAKGMTELFKNAAIKWGIDAPVIHGFDAMLELYENVIRLHADGTPRTHHIITNPIIEISEDGLTATARTYYTVIQQTDKIPLQVIAGGRYHDTFVKKNGSWEYSNRNYFMDFRGDISEHVLSTSVNE